MAAIFFRSYNVYVLTFSFITASAFLRFVKCEARVTGISPVGDSGGKSSIVDGVLVIAADSLVTLRFYGAGFTHNSRIAFTTTAEKSQTKCDEDRTKPVEFTANNLQQYVGEAKVSLPKESCGKPHYVCLQSGNESEWLHQGGSDDPLLQIKCEGKTDLPLWLKISFIVVLMLLSGLFSGLNLGLMALDPTELKIVMNCGNSNEQKYAKSITPLRKHGNYLLCTLLLGNVLVNTSFTILLDGLIGSGIAAILGSTAGIVIFGEIMPQSICSRHGLAVGAHTIWITRFFMIVTFPVSFPISKILDWILGDEIGTVYDRRQLQEMLKVTAEFNDLEGDEMNIISGVLNYKSKTVEEVMTKLDDCYLLDILSILDFRTIASIMQSGHSRIPVFDGERHNIVGLLLVKDLAFIDTDDCTPLRSVIKFYNHRVQRVYDDVHLDTMLEDFKKGNSHLAVVQRVNNEGEGDPFYEAIGIVTLEDILEEIIQSEIVDETDIYLDNKSRQVIQGRKGPVDLSFFTEEQQKPKVSPQLQLAILQYLTTVVEAFSNDVMSFNMLKRLINQPDVVQEIKLHDEMDDNLKFLYKKGVVAEFFTLIIQGKVEVTIGQDELTFEEGPFTSFGTKALLSSLNAKPFGQYIPDYSVRVVTDVMCLKIPTGMYKQAVRATLMGRESEPDGTIPGSNGMNHRNGPQLQPGNIFLETTC